MKIINRPNQRRGAEDVHRRMGYPKAPSIRRSVKRRPDALTPSIPTTNGTAEEESSSGSGLRRNCWTRWASDRPGTRWIALILMGTTKQGMFAGLRRNSRRTNRNPPEYFQQQAWERKWYRSRDARELYMQAAQHWRLSIKSFNDHSKLSPEECGILQDAHAQTSIPNSTWAADPGDCVGPGYFTLPSLNHPGSRVTLRGGPFPVISFPGLEERGFVRGMNGVPLALNCTPEEISAINSFVKNFRRGDGESGLVFSGCDVVYKSNRIEGRFLAIAGRLSLHGKVRVLRCESLEPPMSQLGHFGRYWHIRRMSGLGVIPEIAGSLGTPLTPLTPSPPI